LVTGNQSLPGLEDPEEERQLEADNEQAEDEEVLQEEEEGVDEEDTAEQQEEEAEQEQKEISSSKRLNKPKVVASQMRQSGRDSEVRRERRPKTSITMKPIEQYKEVDNPSDQYLPPGTEPSRLDVLSGTGVLTPYTRQQLTKEYSRMQQIRNAFVIWQSQQEDYIIYQDAGFDETKGKTRWKPIHYQLYPMTTGQRFRITELQAKFEDLRRDIANNDTTIKRGNKQLRETEIELLKLKLATYFRMNIGEIDPVTKRIEDPDDEFEGSSWWDVRDMIESAEWAFQFVPKSRRIKLSEQSGSETQETDHQYGIR
jgi:hypothetical protein